MIAIGFGVEVDDQPVAAAFHLGPQADQRAALAYVGLARQGGDPPLAGHRLADPKLGDVEAADMDVEAGKDRARLLALLEPGQPVQGRELGIEFVDDQPVGDPAERLPVDVDQRRFGEQPLRIVEAHVSQASVAPDRAVDPADPDPQPRFRRHRGDSVGEEAVAGRGVEQQRSKTGEQEEAERQPHRPFRQPGRPAPSAADRHLFLGRRLRHQKAWPSET
jgi:hypothetical protein